ncbi:MAG TPA: N-acetyl-gamma-glutamyl-phosphate reductase [Balneolaceae bacterium]|nr:N-acetyl-gamma-glutamyl-phosphate reductase [Balneolaceae bacterium]
MTKHKVGVVGGTGYTGAELVRLLVNHPDVILETVTSRSEAGRSFSAVHPHFSGLADMKFQTVEKLDRYDLDLVFLALPHGASMDFIESYKEEKYRVIDLSGDFRLTSAKTYEKWYGQDHTAPEFIDKAVFGLPELFRDEVRTANLVANPGCYPTSAILALAPLLKNNLIKTEGITIDAKSGVTGAGATASAKTHFPDVFGNFSAYGLRTHRHTPEIQQALQRYINGDEPQVLFTPHLLPIDRGILSTTYSTPRKSLNEELIQETVARFYEKERFVRVLDEPPKVKNVRGSNYCDLFVTYDNRTNKIITISTIDNLVKGAAGQAVQNMNIMFGLIEHSGLKITPLSP